MAEVRLDQFNHTLIEHTRSRWVRMLWMITSWLFFDTAAPWPTRLKVILLRLFGAKIGNHIALRTRIYIHSPWNLEVGDHCWIGDGCQILSIEKIKLETQVALAHEVYLAAGSHDIRSATMAPDNKPICVCSGTWVASRAFVGPGVTIGRNTVVCAGAVVTRDVEDHSVMAGVPAKKIRDREIDQP